MADGSVYIKTELDHKKFDQDVKTVEKELAGLGQDSSNVSKEIEKSLTNVSFSDLAKRAKDAFVKSAQASKSAFGKFYDSFSFEREQQEPEDDFKYDEKAYKFKSLYLDVQTAGKNLSADFLENQKALAKLEHQYENLLSKMERYRDLGKDTSSSAYKGMEYDAETLKSKIEALESAMKTMVNNGTAFATNTAEANKNAGAVREVADSHEELKASAKGSGVTLDGVNKRLKRGFTTILKYGFGIRSIYMLVRKLRTAIKDGFKNLSEFDTQTKQSLNNVKNQMTELKNGFAASLAPALQAIEPIITRLLQGLNNLIAKMSELFAVMRGQSTFIKAKELTDDYAESVAGASKKLDVYSFDKLSRASGDGGGATSAKDMFETVEASNEAKAAWEKVKAALKEMWGIFKDGFLNGLGEYQSRLDDIKASWQNIKDILKEIVTDANVQDAFMRMAESTLYLLGSIAGALASIGLTIGQMVIGGFEDFLIEHKDQIKDDLVDMFTVDARVKDKLSEIVVNVADLFTVFGGESGQAVVGDLFGISYESVTGLVQGIQRLTEAAVDLVRVPLKDNLDGIKSVIDNLLGGIHSITQVIEELTGNVRDGLISVWDSSVKPTLDAIIQTISNLVGIILDAYNQYIAPIVDRLGAEITSLWKENLQPALNQLWALLNSLFNLIQSVWIGIIGPALEHAFEYIKMAAAFIGPILKALITTIKTILGALIDLITYVIWGITEIVKFVTWLVDSITSIVGPFVDGLNETVTNMLQYWADKWNDWEEGIHESWERLKSDGKDFINGLIAMFEGFVNNVIDGVNHIISAINSIQVDVPPWLEKLTGMSTFGFNLPMMGHVSIPRLAKGAVIPPNAPFLATLGDQKNGMNLELPENLLRQIVREEGGGQNVTIEFKGNLAALGRVLEPVISAEKRRKGNSFIVGGTY